MPSKKKSIDEARTRLQEKVNDVKNKSENFHSLIDSISKEVSVYNNYLHSLKKKIKYSSCGPVCTSSFLVF